MLQSIHRSAICARSLCKMFIKATSTADITIDNIRALLYYAILVLLLSSKKKSHTHSLLCECGQARNTQRNGMDKTHLDALVRLKFLSQSCCSRTYIVWASKFLALIQVFCSVIFDGSSFLPLQAPCARRLHVFFFEASKWKRELDENRGGVWRRVKWNQVIIEQPERASFAFTFFSLFCKFSTKFKSNYKPKSRSNTEG